MPHKHSRKDTDVSDFDLPPTTRAKPLPVRVAQSKTAKSSKKRKRRNGEYENDDTPKAFARLMQIQTTRKRLNGLDNGEPRKSKKRKINHDAAPHLQSTAVSQAPSEKPQLPTILPGERLADFSARVDAALPVAGLTRKTKRGKTVGPQDRQTKLEKRMQRMQAEWRKEEARIKEMEEEERDKREEEADERGDRFEDRRVGGLQGIKKKMGKSRKRSGDRGDEDDNEDDPWAKLKEREPPKRLWDVVQAPPDLKVVPKEKFKVKNGAMVHVTDVPQAAGSLRRREELGTARKAVIDGYRRMMEDKRMQV